MEESDHEELEFHYFPDVQPHCDFSHIGEYSDQDLINGDFVQDTIITNVLEYWTMDSTGSGFLKYGYFIDEADRLVWTMDFFSSLPMHGRKMFLRDYISNLNNHQFLLVALCQLNGFEESLLFGEKCALAFSNLAAIQILFQRKQEQKEDET
jgi:hypothetical protein